MWVLIGFGLLVAGVLLFLYALGGMNWDAPQASDPGNKFVWPSVFVGSAGVLVLVWRLSVWLFPGAI